MLGGAWSRAGITVQDERTFRNNTAISYTVDLVGCKARCIYAAHAYCNYAASPYFTHILRFESLKESDVLQAAFSKPCSAG